MLLAQKGEGIYRNSINDDAGRGKNANGGGGGNDINGGGAGGANFGLGGRGGDFQSPISCPPNMLIQCGGIGGQALSYNNQQNKVFMGGGGGAGQQNNFSSTPGGNGGGIIFIKSRVITGNNNSIDANGQNVTDSISIDGQGGGGAGGAILIDAFSLSGVQLSVKGGNGGSDIYSGWDCHAKGGGGGGGVIWTSSPFFGNSTNVSGGSPGVFLSPSSPCFNSSLGASAGQVGAVISGLNFAGSLNPCEDISVYIPESTPFKGALNMYPNPSHGKIYFHQEIEFEDDEVEVQFYNYMGQMVYSLNSPSLKKVIIQGLEVNFLSKGLYLILLKTKKSEWDGRIVLE